LEFSVDPTMATTYETPAVVEEARLTQVTGGANPSTPIPG
jgi:hypothetical protein